MKYVMTQSQARYIQEQYGFLFLLGLNNKISVRRKCVTSLCSGV